MMSGSPDRFEMCGLVQAAYVVENMDEALVGWSRKLGVGPWFDLGAISGIEPVYLSVPCKALSRVAMAFAGSMMIELIQPLDDEESPFKEMASSGRYGFHHFGIATATFEKDRADYIAAGNEQIFGAKVPTGGSVAYFESDLGGYVELIEVNEPTLSAFSGMYREGVRRPNKADIIPVRF